MPPTTGIPALQQITSVAIVDQAGVLTVPAQQYFAQENAALIIINQSVNKNLGVQRLTLAQAQLLNPGVADAGLVVFLTDFAHIVFWDGAAWQFMGGDQPGQFGDWAVAPSLGWALCDGSATTFLTVGATLGTSAFTTPNLSGTYKKGAGAYTGAIIAATAPGATMSGATATGTTGTGTTGTESSHTHPISETPRFITTTAGPDQTIADVTTPSGAGSAHAHTVPGLAIPGLGAGSLAATVDATGEPAHLLTLPFVRR